MEHDLALAELALKWNIITQKQLLSCMKEQGQSNGPQRALGQILIEKGFLNEAELKSLIRELSRTLIYKMRAEGERSVVCEKCGSVYQVPRQQPLARGGGGAELKCTSCKAPIAPDPSAVVAREESLTRLDFVRAVHEKFKFNGMTLDQAHQIIDSVFDTLVEGLQGQKRVDIRRLGVFRVVLRAPRKARNPRTGEAITIPYRRGVRFKAAKDLVERLKVRKG